MNSFLKIVLSTLALGLGAATGARAEDNTVTVPIAPTASPETPAGKGAGKAGGKRLRDQVVEHDKMLAEKLSLTDAQKQQLADLRKQQAEQMKSVRGDRAKMAQVLKDGRDQVRALLTPDQQKQFDAMPPEGARAGKGKKSAKKNL